MGEGRGNGEGVVGRGGDALKTRWGLRLSHKSAGTLTATRTTHKIPGLGEDDARAERGGNQSLNKIVAKHIATKRFIEGAKNGFHIGGGAGKGRAEEKPKPGICDLGYIIT